jgi:hypothetical protein
VVDGGNLVQPELGDEPARLGAEVGVLLDGDDCRPPGARRVLRHVAREAGGAEPASELEHAAGSAFPDLLLQQVHRLGGDRPVPEAAVGELRGEVGVGERRTLADHARRPEREHVRPTPEAPEPEQCPEWHGLPA